MDLSRRRQEDLQHCMTRQTTRCSRPVRPTPLTAEVVVIGNGPSAICLSYLLSGHWPYYDRCLEDEISPHPYLDETLQARLRNISLESSIVEQDLKYLSEGLEGRSSNPVALLFDALSNPGADLGARLPSLLRWELQSHRKVEHVVLGRKDVGGVWQSANNQAQRCRTKTVSLGSWMELPEMSLEEWLNEINPEENKGIIGRANMDDISGYYREYVQRHRLAQYFRNHSIVTSLSRIPASPGSVDCESGESEPEVEVELGLAHETLWEVCGYQTTRNNRGEERREEFCYITPNVVLATGVFDNPNRLGVPGENLPYILQSYDDLERRLELHSTPYTDPVVVVGGGLSAADAVLMLHRRGLSVVHLHRRGNPDGVYRKLVPTVYPEYHEVNNLMQLENTPEWYTGYSGFEVLGFTAERDVLIRCKTSGRETAIKAALVVVLIGSCPDLTFICPSVLKNLGVIPNTRIDGRRNLVDVDPFTYESVHHQGLYAMGPLVGDLMVRFLRGGALAVTSDIWKKKQKVVSSYIPLDTLPENLEQTENQWTSLER